MAVYELTSPSGEVFEVTAPDTASEAEVMSYFQQNIQQPQKQPTQEQLRDYVPIPSPVPQTPAIRRDIAEKFVRHGFSWK